MKMIRLLLCLLLLFSGCSKAEKKASFFRVGRNNNWYNLQLMGKEQNLLAFTDDLLYTVAHEENFRVEVYGTAVNSLVAGLHDGTYDAVITDETPNQITEGTYTFSKSFFYLGPVLVVLEDSTVSSLGELQNKVVAIETGASLVFDVKDYPDVFFKPYDNILYALENLANGRIDGTILRVFPAYVYANSLFMGKIKVASAPLTKEGLRLQTLPKYRDFAERFNKGLQKLKENGKWDALIKKWSLFDPGVPF